MSPRPSAFAYVVVLGALAPAPIAWAADERISLSLRYVPAPAVGCPPESAVLARVAREVGDRVLRPDSARSVFLRILDQGGTLRAEILFRDTEGRQEGWRQLESPRRDCAELVSGFALLVALHVQFLETPPEERVTQDAPIAPPRRQRALVRQPEPPVQAAPPPPVAASKPPPVAASTTPPVAASKPPPPPAPAPPSPTAALISSSPPMRRPIDDAAMLGIGPSIRFGLAPSPVVGLRIFALGNPRPRLGFTMNLEILAGTPHAVADPGAFTTIASSLGFGPCLSLAKTSHLRVATCLEGRLGLVRVRGTNIDMPASDAALYAGIGPAVAMGVAVSAGWWITASASVPWNPWPWTVAFDGQDAWKAPRFHPGLALTLTRPVGRGSPN